MLLIEVKRIYFEYRQNRKNNKYEIVLDYTRQEEQPRNDFNLLDTRMIFLGQIEGSPQRYIRINMRKLVKTFSI